MISPEARDLLAAVVHHSLGQALDANPDGDLPAEVRRSVSLAIVDGLAEQDAFAVGREPYRMPDLIELRRGPGAETDLWVDGDRFPFSVVADGPDAPVVSITRDAWPAVRLTIEASRVIVVNYVEPSGDPDVGVSPPREPATGTATEAEIGTALAARRIVATEIAGAIVIEHPDRLTRDAAFWIREAVAATLPGRTVLVLDGGARLLATDSTAEALALAYVAARGMDVGRFGRPTGEKLLEEAGELRDALAESGGELTDAVRFEVADVAIANAFVARRLGVTVEDCILAKTEKDRGRGDSKRDTERSR